MTTIDRRTFLIGVGAIAACSRQGMPAAGSVNGGAPLGVQLYSVRSLMATDVAATLDLVAAVGFSQVEFAGYFDHSPAELRRLLGASGLSPVSAHVGRVEFGAGAERAETAGLKYGFVERDHPVDAAASLSANFTTIAPIWNRYISAA